jgi:Fic family protein
MRKFDYSFLDSGMIPADLVNVTGGIYALQNSAITRKEGYPRVFTELESIAKVQSVKSSNAIEGIITSDQRIADIVNRSSAPMNHDEAEIAGYRDALSSIHTNFQNLDFCEKDILSLHAQLLTPGGSEDAGQYKENDNLILEIDDRGQRRVRFRPVPAKETQGAMQQLTLAYIEARSNANINQLLLIPCVILDFLCIHPFRDGNGRMSRLLSLLLLYKNDFQAGKYISFEEQINNYKQLYYASLQESSQGWHENRSDYMPFIKNFLSMLYMCYKELDKRFAVLQGRKITKKARIEATMENSLTPLSKRDLCNLLPDVSLTTVEAVLGRMLKEGRIRRIGQGRATRYIHA